MAGVLDNELYQSKSAHVHCSCHSSFYSESPRFSPQILRFTQNDIRADKTKSPPRTNVGAGLIFAYSARGTTLIGSALFNKLSAGFPLYRHGTYSHYQDTHNEVSQQKHGMFDALPCGNGGLPARITGYIIMSSSVRPASRSGGLFAPDQRVAFHEVQAAGLSPSPVRCHSHQRVFVPRDDFLYAICQVYALRRGLSRKKLVIIQKLARDSSLRSESLGEVTQQPQLVESGATFGYSPEITVLKHTPPPHTHVPTSPRQANRSTIPNAPLPIPRNFLVRDRVGCGEQAGWYGVAR